MSSDKMGCVQGDNGRRPSMSSKSGSLQRSIRWIHVNVRSSAKLGERELSC